MADRHLVASLADAVPPDGLPELRHPTPDDVEELAVLMLDAYRGTIDYDGETLDDSRHEVDGFFAGESGEPLLQQSLLAMDGARIVSALLVSRYEGMPLVAYIYTAPSHKRRGLATLLIREGMARLLAAGEERVQLWVTVGNPAERIYDQLGFVDAPD